MEKEFSVIALRREDFEWKGFDASGLSDEEMTSIASKFGNSIMDGAGDFWPLVEEYGREHLPMRKRDVKNEDGQDVFDFLENYHPYYSVCDEIAWIGDIDKIIDNDADKDDPVWFSDYMELDDEELQEERNRLMRKVLTEAFENFLDKRYPLKKD